MEKADLQSAAAFVEGGIQGSCDDACSICLESFCENDPSTATCCKHEFHLHCILECSFIFITSCVREALNAPCVCRQLASRIPPAKNYLRGVENESGITGISAIPHDAIEAHQHQASHVINGHDDAVTLSSGSSVTASNRPDISDSWGLAGQSSLNNQDSAGPSDFQSFS